MAEVNLNSTHQRADIVGSAQTKNEQTKTKGLTVLRGITTSQVWKREKLSDTPAYCFLKPDEKEGDIPTIFRTKENYEQIKVKVKKYSHLQVEGKFDNPTGKNQRKSFTVYSYQILEKVKHGS